MAQPRSAQYRSGRRVIGRHRDPEPRLRGLPEAHREWRTHGHAAGAYEPAGDACRRKKGWNDGRPACVDARVQAARLRARARRARHRRGEVRFPRRRTED